MAAPSPAADEGSTPPSDGGYWLAETVRRPEACLQAVAGCFRRPGVVDAVVNHERWLELVEPAQTGSHRSVSWTPVFGTFTTVAVFPWNPRRGGNAAETHVRCRCVVTVSVWRLQRTRRLRWCCVGDKAHVDSAHSCPVSAGAVWPRLVGRSHRYGPVTHNAVFCGLLFLMQHAHVHTQPRALFASWLGTATLAALRPSSASAWSPTWGVGHTTCGV